jgi:hypothetical protein
MPTAMDVAQVRAAPQASLLVGAGHVVAGDPSPHPRHSSTQAWGFVARPTGGQARGTYNADTVERDPTEQRTLIPA